MSSPGLSETQTKLGGDSWGQIKGHSDPWSPWLASSLKRWHSGFRGHSGPIVSPSHLHGYWRYWSPPEPVRAPARPVVDSMIPSRAHAKVGAMGVVDSCVKDVSQGQGVSLEKEGQIISESYPLLPSLNMDLFWNLLSLCITSFT